MTQWSVFPFEAEWGDDSVTVIAIVPAKDLDAVAVVIRSDGGMTTVELDHLTVRRFDLIPAGNGS